MRIILILSAVLALLTGVDAQASPAADRLLLRAATLGDVAAINGALADGADVNVVLQIGEDEDTVSPLIAAVYAGSSAAIEKLLAAGANPRALEMLATRTAVGFNDAESSRLLIEATGPRRDTDELFSEIIEVAIPPALVCLLRVELIQSILKETAEEIEDEQAGLTLEQCMQIPQDDRVEIATVLREFGYLAPGEGVPPSREAQRADLLIRAAQAGNDDQVALLLSEGVNPKIAGSDGAFALPEAALVGRIKSVHALLVAGALPDAHGSEQDRALTAAAGANRIEITQALLDAGANPGRLGDEDWPLRSAVRAAAQDTTSLLLRSGAQLLERDSAGRTVLHDYIMSDYALTHGTTRTRRL